MLTGLSLSVGAGILALALSAAFVSVREGEPHAAGRIAALGATSALPFVFPVFLPDSLAGPVAVVLLALTGIGALFFLFPLGKGRGDDLGTPRPGVDERDIMFARAFLEPGTDRFEGYYRMRPENRECDDAFRREPGLLAPGSSLYHPLAFPAADAAFWTIEMLRPFVDGEVAEYQAKVGSVEVTRFLKSWTLKLGAHSVGVTRLRDYHLYTHVGRGRDYGSAVDLDHTFALALTVEMDKEMVDRAPRGPTAMESAHQYLRSGAMAVQLADLIRRLGYRARAHVDGNYRVICPLVARDAGLGELGRMGLLMTPKLGPRCRIAVVTTDLPLAPDSLERDLAVIDFCHRCRKCAEACPSRALPFGDPEEVDGARRWRIDAEACFTLWCRLGTDCARCMAVCPYSHPDNWMHNAVRWGIRNNPLFRRVAVWLDDLVYGRRPSPKALQEWFASERGGADPSPAPGGGAELTSGSFGGTE
jgi:ferredoxin